VKDKTRKFAVLVTTLAFSMALSQGSFSAISVAVASEQKELPETQKLIVKVNEKGFFDKKGRLLGPKNPLEVTKGQKVEITFVFDEAVNSLAIGDVHQMAITADDGWTIEGEKIWIFNQTSSLTFVPGEEGRKEYRVYCIIDCIGMDHLNNLVIKVVG
jgi:hypothetical protein